MHQSPGAHDVAAEHLDDRLVTEADAEDRYLAREGTDHGHGDAGIARRAGARRDTEMRRLQRARLLDSDRVVAMHEHVCAEHQERLHQVVGEAVVVVDQQQARGRVCHHRPSRAMSSARRNTSLLANTSRYSFCGTLSATMPAPAWKL